MARGPTAEEPPTGGVGQLGSTRELRHGALNGGQE